MSVRTTPSHQRPSGDRPARRDCCIRRREISGRDPDVLTAMVMGLVLQTALHKIFGRIQAPLAGMADLLAASAWSVLSREDG
jgi:hypothetical protein